MQRIRAFLRSGWAGLVLAAVGAAGFLGAIDSILSLLERVTNIDAVLNWPWLIPLTIGAVWSLIALWIVMNRPRRKRIVEVYPDLASLLKHGRGFTMETEESSSLACASSTGHFYSNNLTADQRRRVRKLVTLHPRSPLIEYLTAISGQSATRLREAIYETARFADVAGTAVRWSQWPVMDCVIGLDGDDAEWVRVPIFSPFRRTSEWPHVRVDSSDRDMLAAFKASYTTMWNKSLDPSESVDEPLPGMSERMKLRLRALLEEGYELHRRTRDKTAEEFALQDQFASWVADVSQYLYQELGHEFGAGFGGGFEAAPIPTLGRDELRERIATRLDRLERLIASPPEKAVQEGGTTSPKAS